MLEKVQHIDVALLHWIHNTCGSAFLDQTIPFLRNPYFWSPVYLFLLFFVFYNYGLKGLWWCVFLLFTFACCDMVSAQWMKPYFHRIRPCNQNLLMVHFRDLVGCGSGFSFPSTHATNHMGISTFISITLMKRYPLAFPLTMLWALLVCYAQLYVVVHYPSDILGGIVTGALIGSLIGYYFNKRSTYYFERASV